MGNYNQERNSRSKGSERRQGNPSEQDRTLETEDSQLPIMSKAAEAKAYEAAQDLAGSSSAPQYREIQAPLEVQDPDYSKGGWVFESRDTGISPLPFES